MNKLPIVEGLARRSIALGEMMGDTKGTDAVVSRLLLSAVPVIDAANVFAKMGTDIAAANLQAQLLEFDKRIDEIIQEHQ